MSSIRAWIPVKFSCLGFGLSRLDVNFRHGNGCDCPPPMVWDSGSAGGIGDVGLRTNSPARAAETVVIGYLLASLLFVDRLGSHCSSSGCSGAPKPCAARTT